MFNFPAILNLRRCDDSEKCKICETVQMPFSIKFLCKYKISSFMCVHQ